MMNVALEDCSLRDEICAAWDNPDKVYEILKEKVSTRAKGRKDKKMHLFGANQCPIENFNNSWDRCCKDHRIIDLGEKMRLRYCFGPDCKRFRMDVPGFKERHCGCIPLKKRQCRRESNVVL